MEQHYGSNYTINSSRNSIRVIVNPIIQARNSTIFGLTVALPPRAGSTLDKSFSCPPIFVKCPADKCDVKIPCQSSPTKSIEYLVHALSDCFYYASQAPAKYRICSPCKSVFVSDSAYHSHLKTYHGSGKARAQAIKSVKNEPTLALNCVLHDHTYSKAEPIEEIHESASFIQSLNIPIIIPSIFCGQAK